MKKTGIFTILIICITTFSNAQSLREAAEQKDKQEKQQEIKLQQEGSISITDLIKIYESKGFDYIDNFLTARGWKLEKKEIKKVYDWMIDKNEYKNLVYSFNKDKYSGKSKGFFYFSDDRFKYHSDYMIVHQFYNDFFKYQICNEYLQQLENELINKGYKKSYTSNTYKEYENNKYRIIIELDEDNYGCYTVEVFNYKEMEDLIKSAKLSLEDLINLLENIDYENAKKKMANSGWIYEDFYGNPSWKFEIGIEILFSDGNILINREEKKIKFSPFLIFRGNEWGQQLENDLKTKGYRKIQITDEHKDRILNKPRNVYRNEKYEVRIYSIEVHIIKIN